MVHVDDVHLRDTRVCNVCNEHFRTDLNLEDHMMKMHNAEAFRCNRCGWKTLYYFAFEEHMAMHYRENKYKCFDCDMGSSGKSRCNIQMHVLTHLSKTSRDSLQCEICDKYFTRLQITSHMKRHADIEDSFKCEKCHFCCKTATALTVHLQFVHRIYRCDECEFVTQSNSILQDHEKGEHDRRDDYVECKDCRFLFSSKWSFMKHAAQMHATSSWEDLAEHKNTLDCSICGEVNRNVTALIEHMSVHPEYRCKRNSQFFQCKLCLLFYTCRRTVRSHITRTHSGSCSKDSYDIRMELKCTICGKEGSYLENLNRHIITHKKFQEETYSSSLIKCKTCSLVYKSRDTFKAHVLRVHSTDMWQDFYHSQEDLNCFCGVVFEDVKYFNRHIRLEHKSWKEPENYICCSSCRYFNTTEATFKQHVVKEHPGSSPDELIEYVDELKCWMCSKIKTNAKDMNKHLRSHLRTKRSNETCKSQSDWKCWICGIVFQDAKNINRHFRLAHWSRNEPEKFLRCSCCKYYYTSDVTFITHLVKMHHGSSPDELIEYVDELECWMCPKIKTTIRDMNEHLRSHLRTKK